MARYVINGGVSLNGEVTISGAKNAAVAILPAALLVNGKCRIENVPNISDVRILLSIIEGMGAKVDRLENGVVEIPYGTTLEPMTLYAYFEAAGAASTAATTETTEGVA